MGRGRDAAKVVLGVVAGVVALLVAAVVVLWGRPDSHTQPWSAVLASRDGATLTVTVMGGACDHAEVEVDESDQRVVVTARIVDDWFVMACDDVGVDHEVTVELDEPLGDRELVDGAR